MVRQRDAQVPDHTAELSRLRSQLEAAEAGGRGKDATIAELRERLDRLTAQHQEARGREADPLADRERDELVSLNDFPQFLLCSISFSPPGAANRALCGWRLVLSVHPSSPLPWW